VSYSHENCSTTKLLIKERPILNEGLDFKLKSQLFLDSSILPRNEAGLRIKGFFKKCHANKPLISIVTVVFNGESYLQKTIESVLGQSYDNIEYIIIDGGSTDGSVDIIKKHEHAIDYWVSEPDEGIYNAMNKGASLCTGEYIAFLNADDWYADNIIELVSSVIKTNKVDYIFGNVSMQDETNGAWIFSSRISQYKYNMPFPHPSLFVRSDHLLNIGFDESYKAIADYDFILKLINKNLKYIYIDRVFAYFRLGGISSSAHEMEHFRLAYNHFGFFMAVKKFFYRTKGYYISLPKRVIKKCMRMICSRIGTFNS